MRSTRAISLFRLDKTHSQLQSGSISIIWIHFRSSINSILSKRLSPSPCANYSKTATSNTGDLDKPLPYFGSPAESYKGADSRRGYVDRGWPWYQPFVINGSILIFLIYFCILREENDIDELLGGDLTSLVPDTEVVQLKQIYIYNQKNNLSNEGIEKRLNELGIPLSKLKIKN